MTTLRSKAHPHALIPWVLAVVALLGCNALASTKVSLRKSSQVNGGSVTQLSTNESPSTSPDRDFPGLMACTASGVSLRAPVVQRTDLSSHQRPFVVTRRGSAVYGRAPPRG
ncbi:hypothetical protein JIN77_13440 [Verrucomicrobiaceae bacterium R5-34]|uniref:Lipoprotein n=1 Tax=Oceaniferula flava TaxID=2800421 RepID=A0AAE2SDT2_9BACT|nr:hypothetical protein [Oceaniferula flavus]MBK1831733.1 hypothetical protein [Verrucomicrobiaceae bacterium R5-34]MBK1856058.1 hypothetical protein [Oceaniferula flavus]MBM1137365.1 hypothetical protein [Oceaniferula flavus]